MGIRFSCPNGHKLHVKAFLAGKRGICPQCGVQFRVPLAEGNEAESSSEVLSVADLPQSPAAGTGPPSAASPQSLASTQSARSSTKNAAFPPPQPNAPGSGPAMLLAADAASDQTAAASLAAELFPVDPASVWYVRPTQGGQYGPATASIMRTWVMEGRVPPDAFVWSHGWPDWRVASSVVPRTLLEAVGRSLQPASTLVADTAPGSGKEKISASEAYRQRREQRRSVQTVTWLAIVSLLLLLALCYVVLFRR